MAPNPESNGLAWFSPLGISVSMFLLSGFLHVLIGGLTPFLFNSDFGRKILFFSNRTDAEYFGTEPEALLAKNQDLVRMRRILPGFCGAALLALGIFIMSLSWFALGRGQPWALWTLGVCGLVTFMGWCLSLWPYHQAGIRFALADLPPLFWIPGLLLLPSLLLGWMGLKQP